MKLTKKFFVGIATVALLISCLAISTFAESPALPSAELDDVLEFLRRDIYMVETFEGYQDGEYSFVPSHTPESGKDYFEFVTDNDSSASVESSGEDKELVILSTSTSGVGFKMYNEKVASYKDQIVTSFEFKTGDKGAKNGANVLLLATLSDYSEDVTLFSANLADDENMYFEYAEYDEKIYSSKKADAVPEIGTAYSVEVVYDSINASYSIKVSSGSTVLFSSSDTMAKSKSVKSLRLYVCAPEEAGETKTVIDDVYVYAGSFVRNVVDPQNAIADFLIAIDKYANSSDRTLEEKVAVADLYGSLYEGLDGEAFYEITDSIDDYDEVERIVSSSKAYRNKAYAEALIFHTPNILSQEDYHKKVEYRDEFVKRHYDIFSSDTSAIGSMAGMQEDYGDATYADAVINAMKGYDEACIVIDNIKMYSEDFVRELERGYDASGGNYAEMIARYNRLSLTVSKVDPAYKYSDVDPSTKYPLVSDAIAEYKALEAKIAAIEKNVNVFVSAVAALDMTQNEAVSAESPYLTKDFESLYMNYLTASSVYSHATGTVDINLDPTTYTGLVDHIAKFLEAHAYVQARIDECDRFISVVRSAETSGYYVTVEEQLNKAALYLDSNKEKSLEKYEGVAEAIEVYNTLVERLEKNRDDAVSYISAVNEINLDAAYSVLKAAVNKASEFKPDGLINGVDGFKEANVKFAAAEAKVASLEGCSKTLISAVKSLKNATTLSERRHFIFVANSVKDGAEKSISGVNSALADLSSLIAKYNEDVAAANALLAGAVEGAESVTSAVVANDAVKGSSAAIKALFKE